jgi:hypothetical protein
MWLVSGANVINFFISLAPFRCSTLSKLARLERFARDKHSTLLQKLVNYDKKFYNIGPKLKIEIIGKLFRKI